ncbi:flagellar hook-length control protein FliK [Diaminobutyricimonas sp. TR449]|uniref:flagellar hook-length control protein FliK n=1 Tax=Diaminobutyricimonas sp. TR449 TaxID=2708076 RepID=UPI001420F01F|nr:flagellar hook-length control protein FliK [Diaminobutyricimonas sp. TR449]
MSAPISTLPAPVAAPARGAKPGTSDGGAAFGSVLEGTVASQRSDRKPSARDQDPTETSASATDRSESAAHGRPGAEQGAPVGLPGATGLDAALPAVDEADATEATDLALLADGIAAETSQTGVFDAALADFATARGTDVPSGAAGETGVAAQDDAADALLLAGDQAAAGAETSDVPAAATRSGAVAPTTSTLAGAAGPTAPTTPTNPADAHTAEVPNSVGIGAETPTEVGTAQSSAARQGLPPAGATAANPAEGSQTTLSDDQSQQFATLRTDGLAAGAARGTSAAASADAGQTQTPAVSPAGASAVAPAQAPASVAPTQPVTPSAPTAAPAPTQAPTYATQVAGPVFSLASAGKGEHVMTVTVTPENLGPVTVRAVVGAESVRVELFAPTDAGRDALRAIMPDLRRDLAATGMSASLDLSSDNAPAERGEDAPGRERAAGNQRSTTPDGRTAEPVPSHHAPAVFGAAPTIDVMA